MAEPDPLAATFRLRHAGRLLRAGAVVAYPTEAVWGLGCDPQDAAAVARLLVLKGRPWDKGLILIAATPDCLDGYLADDPAALPADVRESWPGPATWLLPAGPAAPAWITGRHPSLAVRVTAHPLAAALCRAFGGPLVSTSANPAGHPPARSALAVRRAFGDRLDLILNGPLGGLERPTPIRDARTGRYLRR